MRILDRQPDSSLSLRLIAKEAGISAPSVYMQFPDARALLKEVVHECWRQMADAMRQSLASAEPRSLFDTLVAAARSYVHYAMERPSRYQLLFDLPGVSAMDTVGPVQPVFRVIAEPLEQMARVNEPVPFNDPILAALLVLSIAHGRIALAHNAPVRSGNAIASVEDFVEMSVRHLFGEQANAAKA